MYRNIFIIALLAFGFSACEEQKEIGSAEYIDMTISVYASLVVEPQNKHSLYPEASGTIASILVNEGDVLQKGQVLAEVETDRESYDVQTADLQKQLAQERFGGQASKLKLIESEINQIRAQFETDSINYVRQLNLWKQNIGSKVELDNRELKMKLSKESLQAAKENYKITETELANLVEQSKVNYSRSQSLLSNYKIVASRNSMVYKLNKEEGESILRQEEFAVLGDHNNFLIEMQIDEVDIAKVKIAQKAIIQLDAYPDQVFDATVSKIYPSKNLKTQSFLVEAEFIEQPDQLYAGLAGEANIIITERKNVLTVPLDYLTENNKLIDANGNEIEVVLGHRNMKTIEVISGIDTSTILLRP